MDIFSEQKLTIPLEQINQFLANAKTVLAGKTSPEDIDHDQFLRDVNEFVLSCGTTDESKYAETYLVSISAVVYLMTAISIIDSNGENVAFTDGFQLKLKSEVPMGAGLGSSASYGVCLAGAFHFLTK